MSHFDESSGVVTLQTPWGHWYQTTEEVYILVDVPSNTKAKQVSIKIKPDQLSLSVNDTAIFSGHLSKKVLADESTWTLEDGKLIRVQLAKAISDPMSPDCCWPGLFVDQYMVDPATRMAMEKKLTLQRFALEHPGFDFSNADISGDFTSGGPKMPSMP